MEAEGAVLFILQTFEGLPEESQKVCLHRGTGELTVNTGDQDGPISARAH